MLKDFSKPLLGIIVLSAFVLVVSIVLFKTVLEPYYLAIFPYLFSYFFVINVVTLLFKVKAFNGRDLSFPRYLLALNGARIFAYIMFLAIYLFFNIENSTSFLLGFLVCYFIYFVFDFVISNKFR